MTLLKLFLGESWLCPNCHSRLAGQFQLSAKIFMLLKSRLLLAIKVIWVLELCLHKAKLILNQVRGRARTLLFQFELLVSKLIFIRLIKDDLRFILRFIYIWHFYCLFIEVRNWGKTAIQLNSSKIMFWFFLLISEEKAI